MKQQNQDSETYSETKQDSVSNPSPHVSSERSITVVLENYLAPGSNQLPRNPFKRKQMKGQLQWLLRSKIPSSLINKKHQKIHVHYIRYSRSQMDTDNLYSSFKWIGDALVRLGIVVDDKKDNLVLRCDQVITIHSQTKLIITC